MIIFWLGLPSAVRKKDRYVSADDTFKTRFNKELLLFIGQCPGVGCGNHLIFSRSISISSKRKMNPGNMKSDRGLVPQANYRQDAPGVTWKSFPSFRRLCEQMGAHITSILHIRDTHLAYAPTSSIYVPQFSVNSPRYPGGG